MPFTQTHLLLGSHSPAKGNIFRTVSDDIVMIWETYTDTHSFLEIESASLAKYKVG